MKYSLTRRQHAALSLLILVLILAAIYYLLLMPAVTARLSFQDRLEELRFQYDKLSQSVDQEEVLRREIKRLKQAQPDESGYLENQPEALAAADLQKYFNNLVADTGGNLISTQAIRDQGEELFPAITIKAHLRSDMESLQRLLYRLRTADKVFIVDNLMIQQRNIRRSRNRSSGAPMIEVRFELTGYMFQEKPAPEGGDSRS